MLLSAPFLSCAGDAGPRLPAVVHVTDGDGQIARVGTLLPAPIVATVLDPDGTPATGVRVTWRTADGRVLPVDAQTDAQGQARARWELGGSEGARTAEATLPGAAPAVFTAIAESRDALPFDDLTPLAFATYDGSGQVVHPDYAATPAGAFGLPLHLAITPYPFGNAAFENPSVFESPRKDRWTLPEGGPNPVVLPPAGYLSDPDLVYVADLNELWLYYRQVTSDNIVQLIRTADGRTWTAPVEVVRAPNHQIVSPSIVRRAIGDWWMFAVNSGQTGCGASTTAVEVRRSQDGIHWGDAVTAQLAQSDLWPWHIDVQWIPRLNRFWALYNVKTAGGCTTPAVYLAESTDGLDWQVVPQAVLVKGAIPELQDIVYRSTFEYDPLTDAVTFWFSGARWESGRYRWGAAVERRHRSALTEGFAATLDPRELPPAPAPLVEWP
ncbi:MAG: Ig-like domain-containing protein [Gemmatimonadales bacterium]